MRFFRKRVCISGRGIVGGNDYISSSFNARDMRAAGCLSRNSTSPVPEQAEDSSLSG